ncbi:hypothetical protein [Stenotrophomonas sp. SY1]|uniref:hypothetical protein n=1 Tax=Stenotrophomonas sp. SY1 TaxID=477235 RepID=UPI001E5536E5|nr:hypothetical protein [Stenotrophomonas sp. SY1]MCD9088280.1 hypothetical protein [Stenotrophomonas sp. SY1]
MSHFNVRTLCLVATASLAALGLSGCLTTPGPTTPGDGRCNDTQLQWAIGKVNDEPTVRKLKQESGAGLLNPIGPATIVSRDHREDRLRVFVDANNVITAVRCE